MKDLPLSFDDPGTQYYCRAQERAQGALFLVHNVFFANGSVSLCITFACRQIFTSSMFTALEQNQNARHHFVLRMWHCCSEGDVDSM